MGGLKRWWHRRRYADCRICGREFRKGTGGGVSRETVCSERCWQEAIRQWIYS